jgi:general secretion pathway protein F
VAVAESLRLAGAATGFRSVERAASHAADDLRQGVSFHEAVQSVPAVPALLGTWIRAGDAAGNLTGMLTQAGERCAGVVRRRIDQGLRWVEPVMVVLVGLLVLAVALAILLPILSLNQSIGMP